MRDFLAGVKRWYRRRFRGFVDRPRDAFGVPRGTAWQQWPAWRTTFACECGYLGEFTPDTYVIRSQEHVEGCDGMIDRSTGTVAVDSTKVVNLGVCRCPVTDARYVKICPQCHLGHWKPVLTGGNKKEARS